MVVVASCFSSEEGVSSTGIGKLIRVEGKMDRVYFRTTLEEYLLQFTRNVGLGWRFSIQQDNSTKHTAKAIVL